jgi:hypothetical protein
VWLTVESLYLASSRVYPTCVKCLTRTGRRLIAVDNRPGIIVVVSPVLTKLGGVHCCGVPLPQSSHEGCCVDFILFASFWVYREGISSGLSLQSRSGVERNCFSVISMRYEGGRCVRATLPLQLEYLHPTHALSVSSYSRTAKAKKHQ